MAGQQDDGDHGPWARRVPPGESAALWNGGDHANIRGFIEKTSGEIANALFANPREVSMTAAKLQRGSSYFVAKSIGERTYLSLAREVLERAKNVETTFKLSMPPATGIAATGGQCARGPVLADVTYDGASKDWSAVLRGVEVTTLANSTQEGKSVTLELLFKASMGTERNDKGYPVLAYNMRVSYEK